ncbi:MAG: RIP metalloprotease RseP [Magnetococcales bacterium]|nr:RIP metalloprotease RseP [Magnetococcales bacterium]MBF0322016.1 RIP metalloprotease RseP [Magnetococcales bacterium]
MLTSTIFWAVVVLGALIFVHELGHFLAARFFQVKVLVFSLGFGPRIWSWRSSEKGTEYQLAAIPLGGYVKMLGESPDDTDPIAPEDRPFAFNAKPVFPRFCIVLAGPMFNFLFAIVAVTAANMIGVGELLPVIGSVSEGMPAQSAGLLPGDRITFVGDQPVKRWDVMSRSIKKSHGESVELTVVRGEKTFQVSILPRVHEVPNLFGEPVKQVLIGILPSRDEEIVRYPFWEALGHGVVHTWQMTDMMMTGIWKIITRVVSPKEIGGPILIADLAGQAARQGPTNLLFFMAMISINLGLLNLLPVPILDGGHLMFLTVEGILGRALNEKTLVMATRVGIMFIVALMSLAFYNDISRYFSEH